jgi:DNA excision repair protein ERCC-2
MGGIFGEGIDLVGERLSGAVIVGVGLPGMNAQRDLIRSYFDRQGAGFDFAYRYPGINRVLQAAGRVIRSNQDRGALLLVDQRFGRPDYRRLLPGHWSWVAVQSAQQLEAQLGFFWSQSV